MYWKLLKNSTNPTRPKTIGPLKREYDSLALLDGEKAPLMNSYFSTIGEKLADELPLPPPATKCREPEVIRSLSAEPPPLREITVSQGSVRKKVELLKINKSTGPDSYSTETSKTSQEQQSFLL